MDDVKREIISKWILENNISEIECLVPDMTGNARGKFIPAKKFIKQENGENDSTNAYSQKCVTRLRLEK